MGVRKDWQVDRQAYGALAWLREPSFWAVSIYRYGQWSKVAHRVYRPFLHATYYLAYLIVRLVTGVDIPRAARIGAGFRIHHFGGVIISPGAVIGSHCTLRQGVTIGSRHDDGPTPRIGTGVTIGAYAQILGDVEVGDGAAVGALALVIGDVPPNSVAVGVPARVIQR